MKLKTLLTVYSGAAMIICLNFLLVPGFWITLYGASADPQAAFLYRLIAALFGGLAVMAWFGRDAEPSLSRVAMLRGLVVVNGLAATVAVLGAVLSSVKLTALPVRVFPALSVTVAWTE